MATSSTEYFDVDAPTPQPRHHRSLSNDYVDQLEEHARQDRRELNLQMKRYHENSKYPSAAHQRSKSDHLSVPIETNRRARTSGRIAQQRNESPRSFRTEEVRPGPRPLFDYDLNTEPVLPSQLPTKYKQKPQQPGKPKIKVQITQDNPPLSNKTTARTPKRSPSASPNSPTAQPELQFEYSKLQTKLAKISATCAPYNNVEPANPRDLTFAKIAAQVDGFSFDLHIWSQTVNLDGLAMVEKSKINIADATLSTLERLSARVSGLDDACIRAKPKDLKLTPLPSVEDDKGEYELNHYGGGDCDIDDPTEALGFIIHSLLHSIELQIQTLKRLSRPLQEATPDAKNEVVKVAKLVEKTVQYFGSENALRQYSIDQRFAGKKALDEAQYKAGIM